MREARIRGRQDARGYNQRPSGCERLESEVVRTAGRSMGRLQEAGDTWIDVGMASERRVTEWRRPDVTSGRPCVWNGG